MKSRLLATFFCAALAALPLAAGCASGYGYGEVYADVAPPAVIVESRGIAPGPDYVWIDGYHRWDGHHYNWVHGRWERPPSANLTWAPGRWEQTDRGWLWYEGRWR
jgi:hypothetical protein